MGVANEAKPRICTVYNSTSQMMLSYTCSMCKCMYNVYQESPKTFLLTLYTIFIRISCAAPNVTGSLSMQLLMVEERRWPLGNKVTEIHSGDEKGSITSIKWKDTLIAWCNSESQVRLCGFLITMCCIVLQVVRVYDTVAKEQISSITFDDDLGLVPNAFTMANSLHDMLCQLRNIGVVDQCIKIS